ncbi:hypothetical protein TSOC_011056 [Tetrabaena socialis]|uniref:Uncharacterized protein n=1 Tax=Tetrabaena socialis TaxID=47790 RepID=A0A2J7ZRP5_9CHLO|nr:hypothetical protein TSOC_011056 [Tetrabaena socialis]|eukprot:PNH02942.1 hypothetical protein TSOC_011056 [Tetrabaena socialis]
MPSQPNLFSSLEAIVASRGGGSAAEGVEVAMTPEELPPGVVREALNKTLALVSGTSNPIDTKGILAETYSRFAIYETNLLWCPHSTSIAAWTGAASRLLLPAVEGIRCHRVTLRKLAAGAPGAGPGAGPGQEVEQQHSHEAGGSSAPGPGAGAARGAAGEERMQMQVEVAFVWRPLAPLQALLSSWGSAGLQLPAVTTSHTVTLLVDPQGRVVSHSDIVHNFPSAPLLLKALLGLPTPLLATLLHT